MTGTLIITDKEHIGAANALPLNAEAKNTFAETCLSAA